MTPEQFVDVTREGIYVLLLISVPPMMVALVVGLAISLFQALTQIQEATLTFVPKIVAMLLTLMIMMPFMVSELMDYTNLLAEKMISIE